MMCDTDYALDSHTTLDHEEHKLRSLQRLGISLITATGLLLGAMPPSTDLSPTENFGIVRAAAPVKADRGGGLARSADHLDRDRAAGAASSSRQTVAQEDASGATKGRSENGKLLASAARTAVGVSPALSPSNHLQCMVYGKSNHQIKKFSVKRNGSFSGKVKLLCGSSKAGYRHINSKHSKQWVDVVTWDGRGRASEWDSLMMQATAATLSHPDGIYSEKGSKLCYGAKITSWRKKNGKVVKQKTWNTAVVVSKNNKTVVTAYPGKCKGAR